MFFFGKKKIIRQYQTLSIQTPKKSGKSQLAGALALYHLIADGEKTPAIYSIAVDQEQSKIIWDDSVLMVEASKYFLKYGIKAKQKPYRIINPKNKGRFIPLSSRPKGKQGLRPSCVISDECHELLTLDLYNSLIAPVNFTNRSQPVQIITTTAGYDETNIAQILRNKSVRIMNREIYDRFFMGVVWAAKEYQKENALDVAKIVNPSYEEGLIPEDMLIRQIDEGNQSEINLETAKAYLFNIFIKRDSAKQLIPMKQWQECGVEREEWKEKYEKYFQELPVFMGLDHAPRRDLTSLAPIVHEPESDKLVLRWHTWITQREIRRQQKWNKPFEDWQRDGYFEPDIIEIFDPSFLPMFLHRKVKLYPKIVRMGYDRAWIKHEMTRFDDEVKFDCVDIANTHYGLNEAVNKFIDLVSAGKVIYEKNPLIQYCAENTRANVNNRQQICLDKSDDEHKIDPIVSTVMAIDCWNRYINRKVKRVSPIMATDFKEPLFTENY